jgi:hypothetical protein
MLYMFRAVSPPIIRSSKTVHIAFGTCQACLLLPLAEGCTNPGRVAAEHLSVVWWRVVVWVLSVELA